MATMGTRIAAARKAAGMGQGELARGLKVAQQTVSEWERDISAPHHKRLEALAKLLGVTPYYLLMGGSNDTERGLEQYADLVAQGPQPATEPTEPALIDWPDLVLVVDLVHGRFADQYGAAPDKGKAQMLELFYDHLQRQPPGPDSARMQRVAEAFGLFAGNP